MLFWGWFFFLVFSSSLLLQALLLPSPAGGSWCPGRGVVVPAGPWEPSFPGAWKIAFLVKMTVANPASIFSGGGVVSRWRGMLPARLLPAPLPLPLLTESLLSFRSEQVTNCLRSRFGFSPPHTSCHSDAAALFHHCWLLCLSFPVRTCWGRDAPGWGGRWAVWGGALPQAALLGGEGSLPAPRG